MVIGKKVYKELIHSLGNIMEEVLKLKLTVQNLQNEVDELKKRPALNVDLLKEDMKEDAYVICDNCNTCVYASISPYKEPCVSCMSNPFTDEDSCSPNVEHICETCKHIELMSDEYPCNMCFDYALWETQNDE